MRKGQITKNQIIHKAAELFNSNGFSGTAISELMNSTGLKKGGIYNHFKNKEEILIKAFNYSINVLLNKIEETTANALTPKEQLHAIIEFYRDYPINPVIKGGCPILNSIVDADNKNPVLKIQVQYAINNLIERLSLIIQTGMQSGEFKSNIIPQNEAVVIFTSIEGGVALSRNFENIYYMEILIDYLHNYVREKILLTN